MRETMNVPSNGSPQAPTGAVMVIGGGISGMQSSLDLANSGIKVYLVENSPAIGGKMAQLDKTFPTNDCSMCIVSPKLVEVGRHSNIELFTHSEVKDLSGDAGSFTAKIARHARYVDVAACTGCGICEFACPVTHSSYFPEPPEEGKKKKRARTKEKRVIKGKSAPAPTSIEKWHFDVDPETCGKCGGCYKACLHGAISWKKKELAVIDQDKCTGCGACWVACPDKFEAISVSNAPELDKSIGAAVHTRSQTLIRELGPAEEGQCVRCGLCVITCDKVMDICALKIVADGI
jgi:heterodisulfide reductase subunit A